MISVKCGIRSSLIINSRVTHFTDFVEAIETSLLLFYFDLDAFHSGRTLIALTYWRAICVRYHEITDFGLTNKKQEKKLSNARINIFLTLNNEDVFEAHFGIVEFFTQCEINSPKNCTPNIPYNAMKNRKNIVTL